MSGTKLTAMIDLKQLRENPARFALGAKAKGVHVDIERLVSLDEQRRAITLEREKLRAEQNRISKEAGPAIGKLQGQLKGAHGDARVAIERELDELKQKPAQFKAAIQELEHKEAALSTDIHDLLLAVPLPPDPDVPEGKGAEDNVEVKRWSAPKSQAHPNGFDTTKSFEANKGFKPKSHIEILRDLNLCDFERGVKIAGSRSYVLKGAGFRLHQAALRYAFDFMVSKHGFTPMSVPSLTREETMIGTGFFPAGREQAYQIEESKRGGGYDLFLAGTGEVGLMGLHMGEILDEAHLPLKYVTVSPCFRREAGAAGKDTAGLYRIHQFDKVEQVVICRASEEESRRWHKQMIAFVEVLLQSLELPYRLLQCCTGDLGVKNADMVDIECWMPGRGEMKNGSPTGDFGETHSASRLYDFQCRRLNMRYRMGGEQGAGETTFCHSLNNTVLASPRVLIPILEMHQQQDGSVRIPEALRPYMGGIDRIGPA
ncbi:MAG: serine--tRNA ligase [Phycisphaerales bacterium]